MSIFSQFRGITLQDLTPAQIESVLNNITISPANKNALFEAAALSAALQARNNVSAGIVQGQGGVSVLSLSDATPVVQVVTPGQAWTIIGVSVVNADPTNATTVTLTLSDGSNASQFFSESVAASTTTSVKVGNELNNVVVSPQLQINAVQGGESTSVLVNVAYQVKQV